MLQQRLGVMVVALAAAWRQQQCSIGGGVGKTSATAVARAAAAWRWRSGGCSFAWHCCGGSLAASAAQQHGSVGGDVDIVAGITKLEEQVVGNTKLE